MDFINSVKSFLTDKIDFLELGGVMSPAVYIIALGAIVILVAFFIALGIKAGGSASKFRKHLDDTNAYILATGTIDESNVEGVNSRIQDSKMPHAVAKGWGTFLEQQTGYPSDYISEKDVLGDRKTSPSFKAGKGFFKFVSSLIILICIGLAAIACSDVLTNVKFTGDGLVDALLFILPVLGTIVIPWLLFVILSFILAMANRSAYKKTVASFRTFQDALDNNVIIFRETQDEFITENIEEINSAIEDILANKLGDSEILEIVTTPKVDETLVIPEAAPAEVAAPAPVAAEVVAEVAPVAPVAPALSKEERLIQLVYIADRASRDPNIKKEELIELATYLDDVKNSGDYTSQEEQDIFVDCLTIISGAYYTLFGE